MTQYAKQNYTIFTNKFLYILLLSSVVVVFFNLFFFTSLTFLFVLIFRCLYPHFHLCSTRFIGLIYHLLMFYVEIGWREFKIFLSLRFYALLIVSR